MSAREPIEPSEIREGDLIRWEGERDNAVEYRAISDRYPHASSGTHYLLDRPKPSVALPEVPTLGWLHGPETHPLFDSWVKSDVTDRGPKPGTYVEGPITGSFVAIHEVTAFTPAVAVPLAALDRFEHQRETRNMTNADVDRFLAAVDAAGESE